MNSVLTENTKDKLKTAKIKMENKKILQLAIEKANSKAFPMGWDDVNGYIYRFMRALFSFDEPTVIKEVVLPMIMDEPLFAKALGYTVEEYGKWRDSGGDRMDFLKNYIRHELETYRVNQLSSPSENEA